MGIAGLALVAFANIAGAYAMPGTSSDSSITPTYAKPSFYDSGWNSDLWHNLAAPFVNFTDSLQTISKTGSNATTSVAIPNFSDVAPQIAHNGFEQFDAWLAGITGGFHIAGILTIFLELMSWLLGMVKSSVDWMLSWIR
jgi:hypothetical protein